MLCYFPAGAFPVMITDWRLNFNNPTAWFGVSASTSDLLSPQTQLQLHFNCTAWFGESVAMLCVYVCVVYVCYQRDMDSEQQHGQ